MKLEGKAAFVTGASRGIGAAIARSLSSEGVSVGLASRSGDDLGLADALGLECDVRDVSQVEDAVARTVERFGRLDHIARNRRVRCSDLPRKDNAPLGDKHFGRHSGPRISGQRRINDSVRNLIGQFIWMAFGY
jgi:NAD(P)-dependent dehydrogenase (short-subunit alcohol dehydrogenase family)